MEENGIEAKKERLKIYTAQEKSIFSNNNNNAKLLQFDCMKILVVMATVYYIVQCTS